MQISYLNIHEYFKLPIFNFAKKNLEIEKKINTVSVCGDVPLNFFPIKSLVRSLVYVPLFMQISH